MKIITPSLVLITATVATAKESSCWDHLDCESNMFCGTDKLCHRYGCRDFYEFGAPQLTGRFKMSENEDPVVSSAGPTEIAPAHELACHRIPDPSVKVGPWAVLYSCDDSVMAAGEIFRDTAAGLPFNVECKAETESGREFQCFEIDMDEDDNEFLKNFLNRVEKIQPLDCSKRFQPLVIRHAKPIFSVMITWGVQVLENGAVAVQEITDALQSEKFDPYMARTSAMRSKLILDELPAVPKEETAYGRTEGRPTKDDQHENSSGSINFVASTQSIVAGLFVFLVVWIFP